MKKILTLPFFILAVCTFSAAQETPTNCPTISVTGPAGVTEPGESMPFVGELTGNVPAGIRYLWSVTKGEILSGQGTLRISVGTKKWEDVNTTATLEVIGLPENCPASGSETTAVAIDWTTTLIDEYKDLPLRAEFSRLKKIELELVLEGPFRFYFVIGLPKRRNLARIRSRVAQLRSFVEKELTIRPDRVFFLFHEDSASGTQIYFVPFSDEPPYVEHPLKIGINPS